MGVLYRIFILFKQNGFVDTYVGELSFHCDLRREV